MFALYNTTAQKITKAILIPVGGAENLPLQSLRPNTHGVKGLTPVLGFPLSLN